jgi:diphosphomevalonate decarboxylase
METTSAADTKFVTYDKGTLSLSATSPINIALIKYWGKVHESLIIPANSSLSITIDQNDLCSKTLVELHSQQEGPEIELILNGKQEKISERLVRILEIMKERTKGVKVIDKTTGKEVEISKDQILKLKLRITSVNNFATASGLASSSSGLSCLSFALA